MKVTVAFHESRLPFILTEIDKDKAVVLDEPDKNGMVDVELTIESGYDVIKIFHAGHESGWSEKGK